LSAKIRDNRYFTKDSLITVVRYRNYKLAQGS
jgi:hypothetical protein